MEGFLDIVATKVIEKFGENLSDYTFVLPGKRAYQILREKIAAKATKVSWEPEFITLTNLVSKHSQLEQTEEIVLLAILYKICIEKLGKLKAENFDAFESWGHILIQDFSGIDSGMIDAEKLYGNVSDLAEIDERFKDIVLDKESEDVLGRHAHPSKARYKEEFENLWSHLYEIYVAFRSSLLEAGIGYTGMICRKAAEECTDCAKDGRKYIFVGFNTFTKAERHFIKALKPEAVYWDEYRFFEDNEANDKLNPDGSNLEMIGAPVEEIIKAPTDIERHIEIIDCPTDIIQCKAVRNCLKSMENVGNETAIVLSDDSLLPVMLESIPENITDVNVTTGRPICDSRAYIFFRILKSIILNRIGNSYPRKDIEFMLSYPCMKKIWKESESVHNLSKKLKENLAPIIDVSEVYDTEFKKIFTEVTKPGEYLLKRLSELASRAEDRDLTEAVAKMCQHIEVLSTIIQRYNITLSNPLYISLLEKNFARDYSPYETEAMSGLQITGILETRCQDFKNLFILSADDDTLPKKSNLLSFIPTVIREHYKLPMSGDFQRMFASYFYHLLMRAENVHILYNSNSSNARSGEASRFIQQIKYLKPKNTYLTFKTVTSSLKTEQLEKVKFHHTQVLTNVPYSASMINTYLTCQKKYALRYIHKVNVPQTITSDFRPSDSGTAVHNALEAICRHKYSEKKAAEILKDFETLAKPIIVNKGFGYLYNLYPHMIGTGDMKRLEDLIVAQIKRVLEYDSKHGEFTTQAVEEPLSTNGFTMRIDRRDEMANGTIRIIDYKSGRKENIKLRGLKGDTVQEKIDLIFKNTDDRAGKYDPVLQTMLYSLAFKGQKVLPAIYSLPMMHDSSYSPYPDKSEEAIPVDYINAFEKKLIKTTKEMTDPNPDIEYQETEKHRHCRFCDFRIFCGY